jgi:hypothetical protein
VRDLAETFAGIRNRVHTGTVELEQSPCQPVQCLSNKELAAVTDYRRRDEICQLWTSANESCPVCECPLADLVRRRQHDDAWLLLLGELTTNFACL